MLNRSPLVLSSSLTAMFLVSFMLVLLFGAFLLQVGIASSYIGLLMMTFLVATYIFCGMFSKTMRLPSYLTADRSARAFNTGQSLAAGMVSFGIFILLPGQIYDGGTDALASFSGWILGACLMVVLFASAINRSTSPTLASVIQPATENRAHRLVSLIIIVLVCAPLLIMQFSVAGDLSETFLGLNRTATIFIMALSIGVCLLLGGMQGLSIARMLAYPLIAAAFLTPLVFISYQITGNPFPQLAYGTGALEPIMQIDQEIIDTGFARSNEIFSLTKSQSPDLFGYISTLVCLACGLAAMPHLLQHFTTLSRPSKARKSGIWGIALMLLIITAVPAFAAFYRVDIYTSLLGLQLADLQIETAWIFDLSGKGALQAIAICGEFVASYSEVLAACGQDANYFLTSQDISVNPSLLVLSSAILNNLPDLATWLLVIGAMAAIWSTADGLCVSLANSMCHDGYANVIRPKSPQTRRLFMSRVFLILVIAIFASLAIFFTHTPQMLFEISFALSAAAVFPALVMRIWSSKTTSHQILAGMSIGFVVTCGLLFLSIFGADLALNSGDELRLSFNTQIDKPTLMTTGFIGLLSAFVTIYGIRITQYYRSRRKKHMEETRNVSAEPEAV